MIVKSNKIAPSRPTLATLEKLCAKYGVKISKYGHGEDSYMLIDIATNTVAAPLPMTFVEIELWLDNLEARKNLEEADVTH